MSANRSPRFRYSVCPFGQDNAALVVQVRRTDGDKDGGPFGFRTSSRGISLDEVLADLGLILGAMKASDDPCACLPVPEGGVVLFDEETRPC